MIPGITAAPPEVHLAPTAHRLQHRHQRQAVVGQRVVHAQRLFPMVGAPHDAVLDQLRQLARQHAFADPRHLALQLSEAQRARVQPAQDAQLPLSAHHLDGGLDGA